MTGMKCQTKMNSQKNVSNRRTVEKHQNARNVLAVNRSLHNEQGYYDDDDDGREDTYQFCLRPDGMKQEESSEHHAQSLKQNKSSTKPRNGVSDEDHHELR